MTTKKWQTIPVGWAASLMIPVGMVATWWTLCGQVGAPWTAPLLADALALGAAVTDCHRGRIDNKLTFPFFFWTMVLACASIAVPGRLGFPSIVTCLWGIAAGVVPVIAFCGSGAGTGDLKLVAVLGAILGPERVLVIVFASLVNAGLFALARAAMRHGLLEPAYAIAAFYVGRPRPHSAMTRERLILGPFVALSTLAVGWTPAAWLLPGMFLNPGTIP